MTAPHEEPTLGDAYENNPIEVAVPTPADEARAAMATVAALREHDVPQQDVLVVASTLREYEPTLARAAIRHGLTPTFWTQLDLSDTQLYHLLHRTALLLAAERPTAAALQGVLANGWVPRRLDEDRWPMAPAAVDALFEGVHPRATATVTGWRERFDGEDDDRVHTFLGWLAREHPPKPDVVEGILDGLVDRYRTQVLPTVQDGDGPALLATETAARATVRMETLVGQVGAKYRTRRDERRIEASWTSVAGLIESIASQPNDVWPRRTKYLIVLGLVESEWPSPADTPIPVTLRRAINAGHEDSDALLPRPSWTGGRARDQFAEVLSAASEGVLLIRHTESVEGETVPRSSLLETIPTRQASQETRAHLLRETDANHPDVLAGLDWAPKGGDRE
jgi:ATP-dependent helicase/nuclease subunit B